MRKHEARFAHAEAMAAVGEKKYALSCEIQGHSADVRAVSCLLLAGETREHIVTGSRDGTACVWRPDPASRTEYILQKVIRKHTGYVSALCVIPPDTQAGRHQRELLFHLVRTSSICKHTLLLLVVTQASVKRCSSPGHREPGCDHSGALPLGGGEGAPGEVHWSPRHGDHHHISTWPAGVWLVG